MEVSDVKCKYVICKYRTLLFVFTHIKFWKLVASDQRLPYQQSWANQLCHGRFINRYGKRWKIRRDNQEPTQLRPIQTRSIQAEFEFACASIYILLSHRHHYMYKYMHIASSCISPRHLFKCDCFLLELCIHSNSSLSSILVPARGIFCTIIDQHQQHALPKLFYKKKVQTTTAFDTFWLVIEHK